MMYSLFRSVGMLAAGVLVFVAVGAAVAEETAVPVNTGLSSTTLSGSIDTTGSTGGASQPPQIPEPSSVALLAAGGAGLLLLGRVRRQRY